MANTLTGRVHEVRPTQEIIGKSGSTFAKREIILDCTRFDPYTGERGFDNTPCVTFTQDRCQLLDAAKPGDIVTVAIDITGRKDPNSDRYYNDIRGYKIDIVRPAAQPLTPNTQHPTPTPQPPTPIPQHPTPNTQPLTPNTPPPSPLPF